MRRPLKAMMVGGTAGPIGYIDPTKLRQALLKVSCFGDSISAPHDSGLAGYQYESVLSPGHMANDILARRRTPTLGVDYLAGNVGGDASWIGSGAPSITWAGQTVTVNNATVVNPRVMCTGHAASLVAGHCYMAEMEVYPQTLVATQECAGRIAALDGANVLQRDLAYFGDDGQAGTKSPAQTYTGFTLARQVLSADYLLALAAGVAKVALGAKIFTSALGASVLQVRNHKLYECMGGIAIHDQGYTGHAASDLAAHTAEVTAWTPHICVLGVGTNDIRNGVTLSTFQTNLAALITTLQAASIYVVLATMPPLESSQANFASVPAWNTAILAQAKSSGCGWWDRWRALAGSTIYIDDGRHPTRQGFAMLGRSLADLLSGAPM